VITQHLPHKTVFFSNILLPGLAAGPRGLHAADAGHPVPLPGHLPLLPVHSGPGAAAGAQQPTAGLPHQTLTTAPPISP